MADPDDLTAQRPGNANEPTGPSGGHPPGPAGHPSPTPAATSSRGPSPAARARRPAGLRSSPTAVTALALVALIAVQQWMWPAPAGVLAQGAVIGGLTALISFGIALVYRANRVISFAQGDLGAVPTMAAVLLIVGPGVPYLLALPIGLGLAMVLGGLVELAVVRRFAKAPRLILTVATLGLAQALAGLSLALPSLANDAFPGTFDFNTPPQSFPAPFDLSFEIAPVIFGGNEIIAMLMVAACCAGLAAFFRFTRLGIAVRASAESSERAALLGIPVARVQMTVWVLASVLAFFAIFLRAGVVGVPLGSVLGPSILIRALAACVIGRMTNLPLIFAGAVALGVVEQAVVWDTGRSALVAPILFVVVLAVLLTQRRAAARTDEQSSWQIVTTVRRVPPELAGFPEVKAMTRGLPALLVLLAAALPFVLSSSHLDLATVIVVFSMVGVSLVVLTGWAGQVSLGPVAFLAIGAAVGGAVTSRLGWDLAVALLVAGVAGAAASIVIGLPALRVPGLLLAVTTLAFAQAVSTYFLNRSDFDWWLPEGRLERGSLFGLVSLEGETNYYWFTLACLLGVLVVARRLRHSRVGRVMVGVRENERGAQAFGVNAVRAKLTAFAVSGFIAAFAGAVFVHQQQSLGIQPYETEESLAAFTMVVIGGLGSLPGAILGAVYVRGAQYFLPLELSFFAGGIGLLIVLITLPGGLGQLLYQARDGYLRWVATRHKVMVPSLFADAGNIDSVGAARQRGLAFLREMADELDAAAGRGGPSGTPAPGGTDGSSPPGAGSSPPDGAPPDGAPPGPAGGVPGGPVTNAAVAPGAVAGSGTGTGTGAGTDGAGAGSSAGETEARA